MLSVALIIIIVRLHSLFEPAVDLAHNTRPVFEPTVDRAYNRTQPPPEVLVRNAYLTLLGREPDPPGFREYVRAVSQGTLSIQGLHDSFVQSDEGKERSKRLAQGNEILK